jgi:[ribosomal protein S5]-alanine N-acetyltransferase
MRIECDKCTLRSWEPLFLESLVNNANNQHISSNMRDIFPFPYTLEDGKTWIEMAQNENPICNFAIILDHEAVGGIGLVIGSDIERISAEVGYWLGENYWGSGITSSALKGILKYGFEELKLERIFAKPLENNLASRRVLEKNGFNLEGILRMSVIKFDKLYNQALYSLIKEDL